MQKCSADKLRYVKLMAIIFAKLTPWQGLS